MCELVAKIGCWGQSFRNSFLHRDNNKRVVVQAKKRGRGLLDVDENILQILYGPVQIPQVQVSNSSNISIVFY